VQCTCIFITATLEQTRKQSTWSSTNCCLCIHP